MEITLSLCENGDNDICSDNQLSNLEYANNVMLLGEDPASPVTARVWIRELTSLWVI